MIEIVLDVAVGILASAIFYLVVVHPGSNENEHLDELDKLLTKKFEELEERTSKSKKSGERVEDSEKGDQGKAKES